MFLVMDGHGPLLTYGQGYDRGDNDHNLLYDQIKYMSYPYWYNLRNKTIYRHAKKMGDDLSVPGFGPNVLFLDGHVDPTVNLDNLTERHFYIPKSI